MTLALIIVSIVAIMALCMAWVYFLQFRKAFGEAKILESKLARSEANEAALAASLESVKSDGDKLRVEIERYRELSNNANMENAKLNERLVSVNAEILRLGKEAETRFNALAQSVLEQKAKTFKESNEARLMEILAPFKENVENLKREINDKFLQESKDRTVLSEHLRTLMDMNVNLGREARELSSALRGNTKVQGDWGEFILESLLERSGLIEGENFIVQATRNADGAVLRSDSGNVLRPDVVLYMPDGKNLVIDSKVSLTNYVNYMNADTESDRDRFMTLHEQSVKSHINELKTKRYQDYVGESGNFVMMFIPNEGAFLAALRSKANLLQYAYDANVVLISPSNLMATVELIRQIWQHDKQTKNAINIAEEAGKLYDKFVGLFDDLQKIGKSIDSARALYESSMKKISTGSGNLLNRVEKLKVMGAKAAKSLPVGE